MVEGFRRIAGDEVAEIRDAATPARRCPRRSGLASMPPSARSSRTKNARLIRQRISSSIRTGWNSSANSTSSISSAGSARRRSSRSASSTRHPSRRRQRDRLRPARRHRPAQDHRRRRPLPVEGRVSSSIQCRPSAADRQVACLASMASQPPPGNRAASLTSSASGSSASATAVGRRAAAAVPDRLSSGGAAGRRVPHRPGPGPRQPASGDTMGTRRWRAPLGPRAGQSPPPLARSRP
jgi:hypothetical protein